jgi:hypothetical protein
MKVLRRRLSWYRLLDSSRNDDVDGETEDERAAFQRGGEAGRLLPAPIEVVSVVDGRLGRPVAPVPPARVDR